MVNFINALVKARNLWSIHLEKRPVETVISNVFNNSLTLVQNFKLFNRGEVCGRKSSKVWKKERKTQLFKN